MAYHGVKFKTTIIGQTIPETPLIGELMQWCNTFAIKHLAPTHPEGTYGNLSIRLNDGILITATSLDLGTKLDITDFVFVQECNIDTFEMIVSGTKSPSSETPIHWTLYQLRPDINAIFHGHQDDLLIQASKLQIPETEQEQEYGSPELVQEVKKMASYDFFNMKNHGFISLGNTMRTAGELALKQLERL